MLLDQYSVVFPDFQETTFPALQLALAPPSCPAALLPRDLRPLAHVLPFISPSSSALVFNSLIQVFDSLFETLIADKYFSFVEPIESEDSVSCAIDERTTQQMVLSRRTRTCST
jgi:hypothetical protein